MLVAILGGGQLAQMMASAAKPLGIQCRVLDPNPEAPAARVAQHICADFSDRAAIQKLIDGADFITYEFENIPTSVVEEIGNKLPIAPPIAALDATQDRLTEKKLFEQLGIPTTAYRAVSSLEELQQAASELGLPAVLKTRSMGYDGKGQRVLHSSEELEPAFNELGAVPLILEGFVRFEREVSIIGARDAKGGISCFPLVENIHREGILRTTLAPAERVSAHLQAIATEYFTSLANHLSYVGVLCIELFCMDDTLLANEYAPRVHNSGHWSIEGAHCSQFESHIRAVTNMPLGDTSVRTPSVMINVIGEMPDKTVIEKIPNAVLHDYGKSPRPGRKLGHVTISDADPEQREKSRRILEKLCS